MSAATIPTDDTRPLTPRQVRWLEFFLDGPNGVKYNAKRAAIAAGYSPTSSHNQGHRNSHNPRIRPLIDARLRAEIEAFYRERDAAVERDARRTMRA